MSITTKQFQLLSDVNLVWDFLVDIYDRENGSGVAAPFFEYALQSSWMDTSYCYLDRLWLDGDRIADAATAANMKGLISDEECAKFQIR